MNSIIPLKEEFIMEKEYHKPIFSFSECYGPDGRLDPKKLKQLEETDYNKWKERNKDRCTEPIKIPMPFIHGDGRKGPLYVTNDWYVKKKKKQIIKNAKEKKIIQCDIMEAVAKLERVNIKLAQLNPGKKKDAKKIARLNIKKRDLELEIDTLQKECGVEIESLYKGSKWRRRWESFKKKIKKGWKKFKRWFSDNKELIFGFLAVAIPGIISIFATPKIITAAASTS